MGPLTFVNVVIRGFIPCYKSVHLFTWHRFIPSVFGMKTLGSGPHHSFIASPPKLQWSISLVYEDFGGTLLDTHCLLDIYMLCHRSTLYLLVAMIEFKTYIHIVLSRGYGLIDGMDPLCILLWPWFSISFDGSTMYYLVTMLNLILSMST
jgi:hypothetical protein